jgi:hypothetical protein
MIWEVSKIGAVSLFEYIYPYLGRIPIIGFVLRFCF